MFVATCAVLMAGFPVAFSLAGVALLFALLGWSLGVFNLAFVASLPNRVYGIMTNEALVAVPLFIFMGVMLERSRVAADLLETMGRLVGTLRGGLCISVTLVGALIAASTGIVAATVVTMGLLSLPTMLRHGYDRRLAAGSICAAGTLGQIIPPSIMLILLGEVIGNAFQAAQLSQGIFVPETVSVGDLFAGALLPGLLLVGLYIAYQALVAVWRPEHAPALAASEPATDTGPEAAALIGALLPPLLLIAAVLGSILAGIATPTEAAAVGATGALLLAGRRLTADGATAWRWAAPAAAGSLLALLGLTAAFDLRPQREVLSTADRLGLALAIALTAGFVGATVAVAYKVLRSGVLAEVAIATARVTAMVFMIVIGAALFSLVFRGLGGDEMVQALLLDVPGGTAGALIAVLAAMFLLGFFLDFLEITLVIVPIVAPVLLAMGVDPVWLGVLIALNLQTSFLTPPFGFALFYLRGVAPATMTTLDIYRGVAPFVLIQLLALAIVARFPAVATWLPDQLFR